MLSFCLGLPSEPSQSFRTPCLGRLAQARLASLKVQNLVAYLLLEQSCSIGENFEGTSISHVKQIALSHVQQRNIYDMIVDYLIAETSKTGREIFPSVTPKPQHLTTDMLQVVICLAAVDYALISHPDMRDIKKKKDLQDCVDNLMQQVVKTITSQDNHEDLLSSVYDSIAAFPQWANQSHDYQGLLLRGLVRISRTFGSDFQHSLGAQDSSNCIGEDDIMALEDDFESHISRQKRNEDPGLIDMLHNEVAAATDRTAFRVSQAAKLCFLSNLPNSADTQMPLEDSRTTQFLKYLVSLRPHDFLACRYLMQDIFQSDIGFEEEDINLLLDFLTQEIMPVYEFERSEVSMGVCLDIMTAFTELWTAESSSDVPDLGASLYEWFIQIALARRISSSHTYICIAKMLQRVIKVRPEYARSLSLPSARTSLFSVLQEGGLLVKYYVGGQISDIFGLFILKEHDSIVDDIVNSLPNAVDWPEGLALRMFVLANLGAAWSTLLRKCIYHIFETPGHIPSATGHATICVNFMTAKLGLGSARELFRLFVAQISYTWLETQAVKTIPYGIFGYTNLSDLLSDVQDELVGQVVMRGKEEEAAQLALEIGKPYEDLLRESFTKTSAYSIARDIAVPPARPTQAPGAEIRLRRILGRDEYGSLIATNFAGILAVFYKTLDQEHHISKGLQKHKSLNGARAAHDAMRKIGSSDTVVPPNQQPSFKAHFLVDEIEHLCRRTGYEIDSMWSPSLYVILFRELIASIHPALGSLHACSVLRRIRILISMAGQVALSLYPLEMSLHSLRPFLTDSQCSEDAVGMFQYMIQEGTPHLKEVPSFLAGIAASALTSMKAFLGSTQESTTQESQHKALMSKAQTFHTWFGAYLDRYSSPQLSSTAEASFKVIVKTSRHVRARGNALKGSYESDLLMELLKDELSDDALLDRTSRDIILGSLTSAFDPPPKFRDDVAGNDEQAVHYASAVWRICKRVRCNREFLLWAARVLGRAFAASGAVHGALVIESESDTHHCAVTLDGLHSSTSCQAILNCICDVLLTDNRIEVGIAERTLRAIVNKAQATNEFRECEDMLPTSLVKSMFWSQHIVTGEEKKYSTGVSLARSAAFDEQKSAPVWTRDLCTSLALAAGSDQLLSELPIILSEVGGLAEHILPYILHLALLSDIGVREVTNRNVSLGFREWFTRCNSNTIIHVKTILAAVLYLRKQPLPNEEAQSDRSRWLDIDYKIAARAAAQCSMYKTALMFLENDYSEAAKASRRSSGIKYEEPTELLLNIYEHIDEQDSVYGVQQPSNLKSLMGRLEYERAGFRSLSFRGAHYDSSLRLSKEGHQEDEESMVRILSRLDLHGLSQSFLGKVSDTGPSSIDSMLSTARKLEQWDISVPTSHKSDTSTVFRTLQSINNATDPDSITSAIENGLLDAIDLLLAGNNATSLNYTRLRALAMLTETDEVYTSNGSEQLNEVFARFERRSNWMDIERWAQILTKTSIARAENSLQLRTY